MASRFFVWFLARPLIGAIFPLWLLLVIGYPSLNEVTRLSPYNVNGDGVRSVIIDRVLPANGSDVTLRSFDLPFNSSNPGQSLDLLQGVQRQLINGINDEVLIYSPLDYWNGNVSLWRKDKSIFNTLQFRSKELANQKLSDISLFDGVTSKNGVITHISSVKIILMYPSADTNMEKRVQFNMRHLSIPATIITNSGGVYYNLKVARCSQTELLFMQILPWYLFIFALITFTNIQSLKSKFGVFSAFGCQFTLSVLASVSITKLFCKDFILFHQLPAIQALWLPFLIAWEACGNIITNYTKFSDTAKFSLRLRMSILNAFSGALDIVLSIELILSSILLFSKSRLTSQYCIFSIVCILINFIMIFTSSTMVLALDFKRVHSVDGVNKPLMGWWLPKIENSLIQSLFQNLLKVKFPIFKSFLQQLSFIIVLLFIFIRWTFGDHLYDFNHLDLFLNKRGFVSDIETVLNSGKLDDIRIKIFKPIALNSLTSSRSSSTWDFVYIFEISSISLFLVCSSISLIKCIFQRELNITNGEFGADFLVPRDNVDVMVLDDNNEVTISKPFFKFKELVRGHNLDVIKVYTSACPFIVSVGLDNQVLVWSPIHSPIPPPVQLPIPIQDLPINHVSMSDSGALITVFLKSGKVKCWSRLSMSWIWDIDIDESTTLLETFFRAKKVASKGSRRTLVSRASKSKEKDSTVEAPVKKLKPRTRPTTKSESKTKSTTALPPSSSPSTATSNTQSTSVDSRQRRVRRAHSPKIARTPSTDSNFDNSSDLKKHNINTRMEFIIVLQDGSIVSVDCQDGQIDISRLCDSPILTAKRLSSPRVNDRIVGIKEDGTLVVSTAVNNRWISRPVKIDRTSYNMGKSLVTPATLLKEFENSVKKPLKRFEIHEEVDEVVKDDMKGVFMETVPFVGMIIRAFSLKAQLVDVQTGIILKEWSIGQFVPNSFKVFHSEPSHCRFCGCASVRSFSIGYTELETNTLIMHTFSIDNRAKNSICLRVERDSRETRCLGFASASEHQHWLSNVEGWCVTDFDMLMGVRRKECNEFSDDSNDDNNDKNGHGGDGLRNRKVTKPSSGKSNSDKPSTSDIWEGWTMSSDGQIRFYEIPNGSDPLIKKLGSIQKFGPKSIVVPFGNVMKIFYLGNDSLIEEDEPDNKSLSPMSQTSSSLSFINRRRKLKQKKYDLTHSTKFDDIEVVVNEVAEHALNGEVAAV